MVKEVIHMILYTDGNCYSKVNYTYKGASISRGTTLAKESSDLAMLTALVCKALTMTMVQ